jgi:hypothetical protein
VIERPDGVKIGARFILAIVTVSIASRIKRVFELRATEIDFDAASQVFVRDCARRTIRLVAHKTDHRDAEEYVDKIRQLRRDHDLPSDPDVIFVEVTVVDASDFEGRLHVRGEVLCSRYRVMTVTAPSVANALAALALRIRDDSGAIPHIYFAWTEGNPVQQFLRFLLFGSGEVAPVTREVLRRAEPDPRLRPHVHVG